MGSPTKKFLCLFIGKSSIRRAVWLSQVFLAVALSTACSDSDSGSDASEGSDKGSASDASEEGDSGSLLDAAGGDSGLADTGIADTGSEDSGSQDQGPPDGGSQDGGEGDASPGDGAGDMGPGDGAGDSGPGDGAGDVGPGDGAPGDGSPSDQGLGDAGLADVGTSSTCTLPPGLSAPNVYGCAGCVSSSTGSLSLSLGNVTRTTFSGTVMDHVGNGQFHVIGPQGRQLFGTVPTNLASGAYSVIIPLFCGQQTVYLFWCNPFGTYTLAYAVETTGCTEPDIRITLTWDAAGRDWELHLIKPGGQINDNATDCTWTSCIGSSPDWGVVGDMTDDPTKDVDNTGSFGPENILLSNPETGVFTVMVEHWGAGTPDSDGTVIFNVSGQVRVVNIQNLPSRFVRTAATITWPGAIVTTSTIVHDCTGNWSSGCRDPIP